MSLSANIGNLATRIGTEFKAIRTLISGSATGNISGLTTTDKTSLVAAINEVNAGGASVDASSTVKGIIEIATLAEVTTGTDTTRAVTPEGVKQATDAVRTAILGAGVPAALDTLDELAAALADDENFAATMATFIADVGSTTTNFVTTFETGLT